MTEIAKSAEGFRTAIKVFEQFAPAVLDVDLTVHGKPMKADLLNLLCLGDYHDDPNALSFMADKLPSMLVFYGLLQVEYEEALAAIEEELELFVQEKWQDTLEKLVHRVDDMVGADGKKIPATLKPAPTKDGIRAAIINENKHQWDDLNARRVSASRNSRIAENIYKGIDQRIKLLNNQLFIANGMINRGINKT